jgi:hypothetical protein
MNLNEIATKADIQQLIVAIQNLQSAICTKSVDKQFLRSADVRKMLNISDSTLQRLRISGALKAKKINGTWFYKSEDIQKIMEESK